MNTNNLLTEEGFLVKSKVLENEIYHYVPRDERIMWLKQEGLVVSIETIEVKDGLIWCSLIIGGHDHYHGLGSCKVDDTETRDHAGLAFKRAIDNALQAMGVGLKLKSGDSVSSLNRKLTATEQVEAELEKFEV